MAMFDNSSALAETMKKELQKKEYHLENGKTVTNLEGICQHLIGRALEGDLQAVSFIAELTDGGKK